VYRSVAVPLDGMPEAELALEWGAVIASGINATLRLLVMAPAGAVAGSGGAAAISAGSLEAVAAGMASSAGVRVRCQEVRGGGEVEEQLARHVRGHRVDVLVTTPGLVGGGGALARLCERVPVPVLVVPEGGPDGVRVRRMLVPLDGTEPAERILPFASSLAGLLEAEVTLLTLLSPSYVIGCPGATVDCTVSPQRQVAQSYLEGVAQTLRRQGRRVTARVLVRARPARAIADFVVSEGVGLLALSGSVRGKWRRVVPEILGLLEGTPVATLAYVALEPRVSRMPPGEA